MIKANVYLTFGGTCEEAFNFYKSVFKKDFDMLSRFSEIPPEAKHLSVKEEDKDKIMHVSMSLDEGTAIMGSDSVGEWAPKLKKGNNFSVSLAADTKEEAERLFKDLSEGGKEIMPMAKTFWGSYFGMFSDKFGINWMISHYEK